MKNNYGLTNGCLFSLEEEDFGITFEPREEPDQEIFCVECKYLDHDTMHCEKDGEVKSLTDRNCPKFR